MNTKKIITKALYLAFLSIALISCSDDDPQEINRLWDLTNNNGGYVLNSGSFSQNNATLSFYSTDSNQVFKNICSPQRLGDTAQDMLIYGNKIYIGMYGSKRIYITDREGRLIHTITSSGVDSISLNPRNMVAQGQYVYVSLYDGYLARIDTARVEKIDKLVKVGRNPEEVAISNNRIFVANSGGLDYPNYDNTVSIINLTTFQVTDTVEVKINPTKIAADNKNNVFVISMGNYGTIPSTLQRINSDLSVDSIGLATLMTITPDLHELYYIYAQYGSSPEDIQYRVYDIATKQTQSAPFLSSAEATQLTATPYSININPRDGFVYLSTSDYRSEGTMYIIDPDKATIQTSFKTGGINPMGIYFLRR